ncbi:MAG: DUF1292 domain-containing protein [Eubacteriales bacterium]
MSENENFITLFDDEGNELNVEILEYFLLNGQEYVMLTDLEAEVKDNSMDIFLMQVNLLDDETEEFVPIDADVEDEVYAFAEKLVSGQIENPDEYY